LDSGIDFISAEFLNILFFQQKNVCIFPYVDLKHLHALEIFTVGYNVIDLESTALYNLREIIEFEASSSYSQNKTFFFIYNLTKDKVGEILNIPDIRCVLNTNENVTDSTKYDNFIFYNKKSKKFLNYTPPNLDFENYLISSSENETILLEKIQQIKITASKIFAQINRNPNDSTDISKILQNYEEKFWDKILHFVELFFNINIPHSKSIKSTFTSNFNGTNDYQSKNFIAEYNLIISTNKQIAKEFIHLLHKFRSTHVNSRNLDLEQLYNPFKLYIYLRSRHWKKEIPYEFLREWTSMGNTNYALNPNDINDFQLILKKLRIDDKQIYNLLFKKKSGNEINRVNDLNKESSFESNNFSIKPTSNEYNDKIPSITNFKRFRIWILERLDKIEKLIK
jgi:hypothetical protein